MSSFGHDVDSLSTNMSRPLVFDDVPVDEVETPQAIEALHPEMMVMTGPRCPEVGFTFDWEIVETHKAPHHSLHHTEDQPNTQISLPPLESHDPIALELEESYTSSTLARRKWSTFLMFSCMSRSRECVCLTYSRSVAQHHGKSTECMSYNFTHFFYVDAFKPGVCLSSSLYLSSLLVHMTVLFANYTFTNMGRPMRQWLHWKYHFTWADPCTISLGVGVVFASCWFAWMHVCFLVCLFVCLHVFFLTHFSFTFFILLFTL